MEEWTALARTVPGTLLRVAEAADGLLGTLDSAHRKLAALIKIALSIQRRDIAAIKRVCDEVQEQPEDLTVLYDARRELVRLRELHRMASPVVDLYGTRLVPEDDERWQTWVIHHGMTICHGSQALENLHSAASHVRASKDAFLMVRSFPTLSPEWTAWVSAALKLFRRAIVEVIKARLAAQRMHDAVTVELEEAQVILNR